MSSLARLASPLVASLRRNPLLSFSGNPQYWRCGRLSKISLNGLEVLPRSKSHMMLGLQSKLVQSLNISGRKMFFGCCFGLPIATGIGVMYTQASVAHAVEDYHLDSGETTEAMMRSETNRFWSLMRKIQLPVLLAFVLLYSRGHPIAVAIDFFLLLFCTRPNPLSIYIFIEEDSWMLLYFDCVLCCGHLYIRFMLLCAYEFFIELVNIFKKLFLHGSFCVAMLDSHLQFSNIAVAAEGYALTPKFVQNKVALLEEC